MATTSTVTATSSVALDVLESIIQGVYFYLANASIYLMLFAFMFGMFTSLMIILQLWKKR